MRKILRNKKGNWPDVPLFMVQSVAFAMTVILVFIILVSFNTSIDNINSTIIPNESIQVLDTAVEKYPGAADWMVILMYIAFVGFSYWSASKIRSSRYLSFVIFIMVIILSLSALAIESFWLQFITQGQVASVIDNFTFTNFFMNQMRYFIWVYSLIVGYALYNKDE